MIVLGFAESSIQLVPDGTILIHIALILLMIWLLNRTFFRPINRVFEARERVKGGRSSEAQDILKQAGEKSALYNEGLREARSEGYQTIESIRGAALAQRQTEIETVKQEVTQTVARETESVQKQSEEARRSLAADAEKMAQRISSNILKQA